MFEPIESIYLPSLVLLSTIAITTAHTAKSIKPVGKFLGNTPPSFVTINISLNHAPALFPCGNEIVFVCDTIDPRPLDTIMVPSVAINAGNSKCDTKIPFISPKIPPTKSIISITTNIGAPFSIKVPPISAEHMATVPIERSIPPVAITKVTPIAINAT